MKSKKLFWVLIIIAISLSGLGIYIVKELAAKNVKLNDHIKLLEKSIVLSGETLARYQEADKLRSRNDAEALDYLRWRFVLKDQVDEANQRLTAKTSEIAALKKDKTLANLAYYNLGLSSVLASDFESAIKAFEEAVRLDPKDAWSYYDLGLLYSACRKEPAKAIECYEKYLNMIPKGSKPDEVKERIKVLKNREKS